MIALRPSGYTWTFFQTSRDPVIQQLLKKLVPFVENDKGKALAACNQTYVSACRRFCIKGLVGQATPSATSLLVIINGRTTN